MYVLVTKGGSHLKKVSENETRMYTLCTLNGKELNTGYNSSPNSEHPFIYHALNTLIIDWGDRFSITCLYCVCYEIDEISPGVLQITETSPVL